MVIQVLLANALIGLASFALIFGVTRQFLEREVTTDLDHLAGDLVRESVKFGNDRPKFIDCIREDVEERGADRLCIVLLDGTNGVAFATRSDPAVLSRMVKESARGRSDCTFHKTEQGGEQAHRVVRLRAVPLPDGGSVLLGYNVTPDHDHLLFLALASLGALLLNFLLTGIGAWLLGSRFTRALAGIAAAARRIEDGELAQRVRVSASSGREIASLARAFNAMCDANERTLNELWTLSDNIAHDLRTPLTRMQGNAELAATGALPVEDLPPAVAEETSAMIEMINTMLEISQTGCRIERTPRTEVDLSETVRRVAELYGPVAEDKAQRVALDLPPEPVVFHGHAGKLQQLVANLLDNAIKFTPEGGRVLVSLTTVARDAGGRAVRIAVSDDGPGIARNDLPHIFTRFWRSDSSRTLPGNGLGLALVKAIATSYGGTVEAENLDPHGACFTVTLPLT